MIKVIECLDIALIEALRQKYLQKPLDELDSFSYHLVILVDDVPLGTVRFHAEGESLIVNCLAVTDNPNLREMLARSIISRAVDLDGRFVVVREEGEDIFTELGFTRREGEYIAEKDKIVFNCKCGGH